VSDLISRALLCGLGLASLSKDAIQKTAEEFIEQSKISEDEGERLLKELHKKAAKVQKTLDKKVENAVNQALHGLHIAVVKVPAETTKVSAKSAKTTRKPSVKSKT
jgi:polyhydroxyalkanoate synthesis regulator phasin